jgi:hypothetical protein
MYPLHSSRTFLHFHDLFFILLYVNVVFHNLLEYSSSMHCYCQHSGCGAALVTDYKVKVIIYNYIDGTHYKS